MSFNGAVHALPSTVVLYATKPEPSLVEEFRFQFDEAVTRRAGSPTIAPHPSTCVDTTIAESHAEQVSFWNGDSKHNMFQAQSQTTHLPCDGWIRTPSINLSSCHADTFMTHGYYDLTKCVFMNPSTGDYSYWSTPTLGSADIPLPCYLYCENAQPASVTETFSPDLLHNCNWLNQTPSIELDSVSAILGHRSTESEEMHDFTSLEAIPGNHGMRSTTPTNVQRAKAQQLQFTSQKRAGTEIFRFLAVLNAPTAMTEHVGEIPISYLNKGQCYSLSIVDTSRTSLVVKTAARYRTCIRVSFDEDEQRRQPSECWRLWKQGRSTDEVCQGQERTLAVEFSETHQPTLEEHRRSNVELEKASLDSFSVIWAPISNTAAEVDIAVRFNFVSTDFSRSKGIKGAIVRICAKTHIISEDNYQPSFDATSELCFCKAKVFRDHGSKRKLSNDMVQVNNSIEKLRSGKKGIGSSVFNTKGDVGRLRKIARHRNSWYSPRSIATAALEDHQSKLRALTGMLSSTRPNTVLNLRGQEEDDPDLYPLIVAARKDGSSIPSASQQPPREQCRNYMVSGSTSKMPPSPSSLPLGLAGFGAAGARHAGTVKAQKDCSSQQPKEAVACFYVAFQEKGEQRQPSFYQVIYLKQRTLCDLNSSLAIRFGIKLSEVRHTLRLIENGLEVEIDDDVVRELMEGQDMRLEIENVYQQPPPQITKDYEATESATAECESVNSTLSSRGVTLRLKF